MIRKVARKPSPDDAVDINKPPKENAPEIPEVSGAPPVGLIVKYTQSDTYRTVYSNHSKVGISQWDFTVMFGQAIEKDGQNVIEESIAIKFSPQYFKTIVASLSGAVAQWEATFGEIQTGLGQSFNEQGMNAAFDNIKGVLGELDKRNSRKTKS
ncbi:MAG: hypothetical protein B7Z75_09385 [Acidocella sp. 20-57-95]|nr:MAG: hypothetical protein B7Z75_09385 [Acidocella sp. 20-57-95]HQT65129.1 DUF3467 domain-containing protein [Acidocella sp.]